MRIDKSHSILVFGLLIIMLLAVANLVMIYFFPDLSEIYGHYTVFGLLFSAVIAWLMYKRERSGILSMSRWGLSHSEDENEPIVKDKWETEFYQNIRRNKQTIQQASEYIQKLSKGEQIEIDQEESNALYNSILNLQQELNDYRQREERRTWQAEGLAKFSQLLREHTDDMKQFGFQIISETVKYIDANQGAIFLVKEDEETEKEYLDMIGCYAFSRRKKLKKRVDKGEGLLGQALQEKDSLYITEVPEDYINITSGLGKAVPKNIVVIPLINEDVMVGALEVATFNILEEFELKFLKDLGKNIASTLSVIKAGEHTQRLLEEAQHLSQELRSSEEEMRQNMEEMEATQEEMKRNQTELSEVFNAINNTLFSVEFTIGGDLIKANQRFQDFMGWEDESYKALHHDHLCTDSTISGKVWTAISKGETINVKYPIDIKGKPKKWVEGSYSPVRDVDGTVKKVLLLAQDITLRVENELKQKQLSLVADNTDNLVIITNKEGKIEYVNKGFENTTGYSYAEVLNKKPGSFLQGPETNKETVQRIGAKLRKAEPIYEEILNYRKSGETYWVSIVINPVLDPNGELEKFIAVQADITETKKTALDAKYKLEAISRSNAVIEFDTEGKIIDVNKNFLDIVGYQKEELVGQHHKIMVSNERANSAAYLNIWQKVSRGEYVIGEFERINKAGEKIYLKGVFNPIFDINGKAVKVVKFATDITQEKKLELQSKKQQAELYNQLEAINNTIATLEFDTNGKIINANDIYLSITGFTLETLIGKSYFDLLPEKDREKPQYQMMWDNLLNGQFFSGEFKQKDHKGHEMWLTGTINPINDFQGQLEKVLLLAQFTTKSKQKLNELSGSVTAMKSVIPILELNADFSLKNGNPLFFQESGYSRMKLKHINFEERFKFSKPWNAAKILEELKSGKKVETEISFKTEDGNWKMSSVSVAAVQNLDLEIDKIILLFTGLIMQHEN